MWPSESIITVIGGFLDFQGLARFCLCSAEVNKVLRKEFITKSRPAVIDYLGNMIMEEREAEPCTPYTMIVRDAQLIRFENLDEENTGRLMFFSTALSDDEESLVVRASYVFTEDDVVSIETFIEIMITPSKTNPAKNGTVRIKKQHHLESITESEYTEGFNPRLVIEWCPVARSEIRD